MTTTKRYEGPIDVGMVFSPVGRYASPGAMDLVVRSVDDKRVEWNRADTGSHYGFDNVESIRRGDYRLPVADEKPAVSAMDLACDSCGYELSSQKSNLEPCGALLPDESWCNGTIRRKAAP